MLELSGGADIVRAINWLYLAVVVFFVGISLWFPPGWWRKAIGVTASLVVFVGPVYLLGREREKVVEDRKARYEAAKALFDERCKSAGEKIYKTVEGVRGVFVLTPRTEKLNSSDQYKLDDPYGYAGTGTRYLELFIRGRPTTPTHIAEAVEPNSVVTYEYVEVADESGAGIYRYTTSMPKEESERLSRNGGGAMPLHKEAMPTRSSRYGVAWSDLSTRRDREHWIAGSSQKIVDLQTGEVLAERIGYMFDRGLGSTAGGRSPWGAARSNACPPLDERSFYFFDRVLQPAREASK